MTDQEQTEPNNEKIVVLMRSGVGRFGFRASGENPWQVDQESEMRGGEAPQASAQGAQGGVQGERKTLRKADQN